MLPGNVCIELFQCHHYHQNQTFYQSPKNREIRVCKVIDQIFLIYPVVSLPEHYNISSPKIGNSVIWVKKIIPKYNNWLFRWKSLKPENAFKIFAFSSEP